MSYPSRWSVGLMVMLLLCAGIAAAEARKKGPEGARLYIIAPADGAMVRSPVTVQFGLSGMGVAPAGVAHEKTGHHHLLINTDINAVAMGKPLPASDTIRHFGGGQTETVVELPPGKHTLQLLMGDENHVPFEPPLVSEKITITVQ